MNNNPLVNAREQIKGACEVLGYKEEVYESLKDPLKIYCDFYSGSNG